MSTGIKVTLLTQNVRAILVFVSHNVPNYIILSSEHTKAEMPTSEDLTYGDSFCCILPVNIRDQGPPITKNQHMGSCRCLQNEDQRPKTKDRRPKTPGQMTKQTSTFLCLSASDKAFKQRSLFCSLTQGKLQNEDFILFMFLGI